MYAIIKTGGKQYRVEKDSIIDVELLPNEESVEFSEVLMLNDGKSTEVGAPSVKGALVQGKVLGIFPGPKVQSMKFKRRKNYRRKFGHRQKYTRVQITDIVSKGGKSGS